MEKCKAFVGGRTEESTVGKWEKQPSISMGLKKPRPEHWIWPIGQTSPQAQKGDKRSSKTR